MAEPVDLNIEDGEQIAIIGDNASGKSRLTDMITGRYPLLMNEVEYHFGESAHTLVSENLRHITFHDAYGEADGSYYYQKRWNQHDMDDDIPTLRQWLKVGDTEEGARLMSLLYPDDMKGHTHRLLDAPVITLSSGELRRAQLARALSTSPKVLILDNPFIGLDVEARTLLCHTLEELIRKAGLQVILILNRPDEVPAFVTHLLPVEGLRLMPKVTRAAWEASLCTEPGAVLTAGQVEDILGLPEHDVTREGFYPEEGGEILHFTDVSIRYGARTILDRVNWTVHEGERWQLSGRNGSGKSTLLSLVCADNPQAYACHISLFGHRRGSGESIWEIKKHIGYVCPEMHRAYQKNLPAIDVVASGLYDSMGLYMRPRPEQRAVCLWWMDIFGIGALADRPFLQLSSGEQRLCLLARAFVKDPELLILDEPFHGLDFTHRRRVQDIIEAFCRRRHKTLIIVSHYAEEIPSCVTRRFNLGDN